MKISIIIPVYNVNEYIGRTLDSVCELPFADWECICVNDGSTDGSEIVVNEFSARDSRISLINQANRGVSVARNVGIERSIGDWVSFLDGDDLLVPDVVKEAIEGAVNGEDVVSFDMDDGCAEMSACAKIFRGKFLKDNEIIFDEGIANNEDMAFMVKVMSKRPMVRHVSRVGYRVTRRPGSASRRNLSTSVFINRLKSADSIVKSVEFISDRDLRRKYIRIVLRENFGDMRIGKVVRWSDDKLAYLSEARQIVSRLLAFFSNELTSVAKLMLRIVARYPQLIVGKACVWVFLFKVLMKFNLLIR